LSLRALDRPVGLLLCASGAFAALLLVWIVLFVAVEASPFLREAGLAAPISDAGWHPTDGSYNMLPIALGTLAVGFLAIAIAGPLGLAAAVFETVYAPPRLRAPFRRLIELLAGMPSVVYGLWGLTALVPLLARMEPPGTSLLAAGIVLAVMILPTMALLSSNALTAVPAHQIRAAEALGLPAWRRVVSIMLPAARSGIATGLFLALARGLGETMAVLMVAGNVAQIPSGPLEPVRTLTANIALEMAYAMDTHRAALFFSGFLVMTLTLALVLLAERLKGYGGWT